MFILAIHLVIIFIFNLDKTIGYHSQYWWRYTLNRDCLRACTRTNFNRIKSPTSRTLSYYIYLYIYTHTAYTRQRDSRTFGPMYIFINVEQFSRFGRVNIFTRLLVYASAEKNGSPRRMPKTHIVCNGVYARIRRTRST